MRSVIFSFTKPTPHSIVASNRITTFVSETLQLPIVFNKTIGECTKLDLLFIVNGAFAFSDSLAELAEAVRSARHVVWVQNDYTLGPPKSESTAQSPFRKAFVERRMAGLPDIHYWTTVKGNVGDDKLSTYVNWNSLTYDPITDEQFANLMTQDYADLFYYGAFRKGRSSYFEKYLRGDIVPTTISTPPRNYKQFQEICGGASLVPNITDRSRFYETIGRHGMGLYIEDKASCTEFHSPANRFYEMLSAGLPMVFGPGSIMMLQEAGFNVRPYVVGYREGLREALENRVAWAKAQRAAWAAPYAEQLTAHVIATYKALCEEIV